jgi:hypothetical protein
VSFLGIFHGAIDLSSLSRISVEENDWKNQFNVGDTLQARIIFVDQAR